MVREDTDETTGKREAKSVQWFIRLLQSLGIYQFKKSSGEEYYDIQPPRYRPESLDYLSKTTKFTKKELQFMYRGFKQFCPTGVITEDVFKEIYAKFFPLGNASYYAHYLFVTLDQAKSGIVTFRDVMMGLSTILKGDLKDKMKWAFSLYDINNDGLITKSEMLDVATSIYCLMGANNTIPLIDDFTARNHVEKVFQKIDSNSTGVITVEDFINYCTRDEAVSQSMMLFDSLW